MLIYIHGFNSSSQSGKAREMAQWMAQRGLAESFQAPDLPDRAERAIAQLESTLLACREKPKLVGSSMGGYYATWLAEKHDLKAVLINPCVACDDKLAEQVGKIQTHWHSGEQYLFSPEHLSDLSALRLPRLRRPHNFLLLVEAGDEVLDYREAVGYYSGARQIVLDGGDHSFSHFSDYLPEIIAF